MKSKPTKVTPKLAAKWLQKNASNRPLSQTTVDRYAEAMSASEWKVNGDAIRFAENGDLIDGQHRLHACVKSGKSFMTYVVTNLPEDAYDTIDQGRPRTLADVLARRGEKSYTTLASALRYLHMMTSGWGQNRLRPAVMDDLLNNNPNLREAVSETIELMHRTKSGPQLIPGSHVACLYYLFGEIKPQKNKDFWDRVLEGTDLKKDMPEYHLRKRMLANMASQSKLSTQVIFAFCIKAWNASSQNQPMKYLKWTENEEFPKIVGSQQTIKMAKTA